MDVDCKCIQEYQRWQEDKQYDLSIDTQPNQWGLANGIVRMIISRISQGETEEEDDGGVGKELQVTG